MRQLTVIIAVAVAALLQVGCAHRAETPEQAAERARRAAIAAAAAKAYYCGLPEETRARIREKATDGMVLVTCP